MLQKLFWIASAAIVARAQALPCNSDIHYDAMCDKCNANPTCANIYHLSGLGDSCSETDKHNFKLMFLHLWQDRAYGLPESDMVTFCERDNYDGNKALLLYYQWGPSCNDGETFEMYPNGQNGFCYCGTDCDKSYSNPPMNALLTALVIIIGINILFNAALLFMKQGSALKDKRPAATISRDVNSRRIQMRGLAE